MKATIKTIITNTLDMKEGESGIEDITPDVALDIDITDTVAAALPRNLMWSAVIGSVQATIMSLHESHPESIERMLRHLAKRFDLDLADAPEGFVGPSEG